MRPVQVGAEGLELLTEDACFAFAARQSAGWLALSVGALPAVFPVPFCMIERDVVVRIAEGPQLEAARGGAVVALGIDEFDGAGYGWSVLIVGVASALSTDEISRLAAMPAPDWRTGASGQLVRIHTELVSGRKARIP